MKKCLAFTMIVLTLSFQFGCEANRKNEADFQQLCQPHKLRKAFVSDKTSVSSSFSANYFLFLGSASGTSQAVEIHSLKFAWEDSDSTYILTEVPIDKVRVKIEPGNCTPTAQLFFSEHVNFCASNNGRRGFDADQQKFVSEELQYVIITCAEKDWDESIKLPWNNQEPQKPEK